jgi:hypothetical protein
LVAFEGLDIVDGKVLTLVAFEGLDIVDGKVLIPLAGGHEVAKRVSFVELKPVEAVLLALTSLEAAMNAPTELMTSRYRSIVWLTIAV